MHLQIKKVCGFIHRAAQSRLSLEEGQFELFGCDFMLDTFLTPYLLEVNTNPALFTDTKVQAAVIPSIVRQTLDIMIDLYSDRARMQDRLLKKEINLQLFETLINDVTLQSII